MKTPVVWIFGAILAFTAVGPASAGQIRWVPGGVVPALVLDLGNGKVKKTIDLPAGALDLDLVLRKFLLDDDHLVITWKSDGVLWMRLAKKIPGAETTDRVVLPPGRQITLEISTDGGTSVALITIRRK